MQSTFSKNQIARPLTAGMLGLTLMLPAMVFFLTWIIRILGARSPYCFFAPSFLQTRMNLFEFHKAQFIILTLLLAIILNVRIKNALSTAVALQGTMLLIILYAYTLIQHLRY